MYSMRIWRTVNLGAGNLMLAHKIWVSMDDLSDALARKSLLSESSLDLVEDLGMIGIRVIQNCTSILPSIFTHHS